MTPLSYHLSCILWLPWWLNGKNLPASVGDMVLSLGWVRSSEEGNGNLLQYSYLGDHTVGRGAWRATALVVSESGIT